MCTICREFICFKVKLPVRLIINPLLFVDVSAVEEDGTSVGGIVGGVVASVTVIAVIILVVIIMRRRMDQKSNMYRHNPGEQMTHRSSLTSRKS